MSNLEIQGAGFTLDAATFCGDTRLCFTRVIVMKRAGAAGA